jgi:hypothetical protein
MSILEQTGRQFFPSEEEMDIFLEDIRPGSTVIIREWGSDDDEAFEASWCPGKNIAEYFPEGAGVTDGDIYWYSKDKLWHLIPAFGKPYRM